MGAWCRGSGSVPTRHGPAIIEDSGCGKKEEGAETTAQSSQAKPAQLAMIAANRGGDPPLPSGQVLSNEMSQERAVRLSLLYACLGVLIDVIVYRDHRERVLDEYVDHYNHARPHRSLGLQPARGSDPTTAIGAILRRQRLGGLINEYERARSDVELNMRPGTGLALLR